MKLKNLFLVFAFLFVSSNVMAAPRQQSLNVGDAAPCTTLSQLLPNGTGMSGCIADAIDKEKHKAVILDFMSIECSFCIRDLPAIAKLAADLKDVATVRQVSLDENVEELKAWYAQKVSEGVITWPMAMDPRNKSVESYKISGTPTVYVIKGGYIAYAHVGMLRAKDVEDIKKVVNQ